MKSITNALAIIAILISIYSISISVAHSVKHNQVQPCEVTTEYMGAKLVKI